MSSTDEREIVQLVDEFNRLTAALDRLRIENTTRGAWERAGWEIKRERERIRAELYALLKRPMPPGALHESYDERHRAAGDPVGGFGVP